ncbi:MAG: hypothetical protein QW727_03385 [Candidatus Pacearchaeota archaeon]
MKKGGYFGLIIDGVFVKSVSCCLLVYNSVFAEEDKNLLKNPMIAPHISKGHTIENITIEDVDADNNNQIDSKVIMIDSYKDNLFRRKLIIY